MVGGEVVEGGVCGVQSGFEEGLNLGYLINWPIKSLLYIGPEIS